VRLNQYGRTVALLLMALFALTLLSRRLSDWVARPFVALGNRLTQAGGGADLGALQSLLLGVATGLLWAPCAGPILGLVLTGAAISGPNARTSLLLFTYAAGAATSLAVAILAGGRVFAALKRSLGAGEWVRRGLGAAVLLAVAAIALGWDSTVLTRLSLAGTNHIEQSLITAAAADGSEAGRTSGGAAMAAAASSGAGQATGATGAGQTAGAPDAADAAGAKLGVEGELPPLGGATAWLNSPPLTVQSLRGKVVLVDFWTYSCINCLRALPYVSGWYAKYKDHGLVVLGVHAPEFAFEKDVANVRRAVADLGIRYPVALDDDYAIWQGFNNQYWPAHYFIDAQGRIRAHHFGEGGYAESEQIIRALLIAAGHADLPPAGGEAAPTAGIKAAADMAHEGSPETYIGYQRAQNFSSAGGFAEDRAKSYSAPGSLALNHWALAGSWSVDREKAVLRPAPGKIEFRFIARDLHLVLGPGSDGKPIRYRVLLDGAAPGASHGADTDADGRGVVTEQRLYQLIRQSGEVGEHTFSIEFLDPGVQGYSFTFG
jgi:thiol-disulfide isomerase/thioredoxin